jgi:uncharacterized protein YceK
VKNVIIICLITSLSVGCAKIRNVTSPEDENLLSGSGSLITNPSAKAFEKINIDDLVKEYQLDNLATNAQNLNADAYKYRRNELQERIIAASNQRCGAYIRMLTSSKAQTKTSWNSLSLLLSGAAAVVTHTTTAQALAAGSTASTGILSTYNEAYYNDLSLSVIADGISKKRDSIMANLKQQKNKSLLDYPVNAAISDALSYHAACNIVAGMEAASTALKEVTHPALTPAIR